MPTNVVDFLYPIASGIIAYFLKRTMDRLDKTENKVIKIEKDYVTETSHEKAINKIEAEFQEVRTDIKDMSSKFLTKEDYFREQAKMDKKIEKMTEMITELLVKVKGG